MIRLDGEGLLPRGNRPQSFRDTTELLAREASTNQTAFDFYRSFSRLNSTYPNLHTTVSFTPELLKKITVPGPGNDASPNIWLGTEVLTPSSTRILIADIKDDPKKAAQFSGAEVIEINHQPINKWLNENFIYCKRALRTQCDRNLEENILSGVLDWKGGPLIYTVQIEGQRRDLPVSLNTPEQKSPAVSSTDPYAKRRCDWKWQQRYPGFNLVYRGYFACLFEKQLDPQVELLRIASFQYRRKRERIDPKNPIQDLEQEVEALKKNWIPRSAGVRHLIVDLIGNSGGNEPIAYYKILLQKPFREQLVEFKKTPELEDARLRAAAFWNDDSHELWFKKIARDGSWAKLKYGDFTEPTPAFCPDPKKPCDEGYFTPDKHDFRGKVSVMIDDDCISSCDGFAWELHHYLGANLYGFYQAADTAYSRLRIDVIRDSSRPNGFRLKVNPQGDALDPEILVGQDVAASLTTEENGHIISGHPIELKRFVPMELGDYHAVVLKSILRGE